MITVTKTIHKGDHELQSFGYDFYGKSGHNNNHYYCLKFHNRAILFVKDMTPGRALLYRKIV